jgi:hypothetical protein
VLLVTVEIVSVLLAVNNMKNVYQLLLTTILLLISTNLVVGAIYVKDSNSCPSSYQSQNCLGGTLACGYSSSTLYCANPTTTNAAIPATNGTSSTTVYNSSLGGGYVLDCVKADTTCLPWLCQYNASCYTPHRQTTCLAGTTDFVCGNCISGYQNCTTPLSGGCNEQTGVTAQDTNHTVYAASCGYACASGYQNCSGQSASVEGCNFQTGVTTCDVGGGEPGLIGAGCTCVALAKVPFYTNNLTVGYGNQLLWGLQNSPTGYLANLTNNATGGSFLVNGSGCIKYGVSDWSCNASSGGGTSYDQDLNTYDNVTFNELNVSTNVNLENNFWIKFKNAAGVLTNIFSYDTSDDIQINGDTVIDGDLDVVGVINQRDINVRAYHITRNSTLATFRDSPGSSPLRYTNGPYFGSLKLALPTYDTSKYSFGQTWTAGAALSIDATYRFADNGKIQVLYYSDFGTYYTKVSRNFGVTTTDSVQGGYTDMSSDGNTWCVNDQGGNGYVSVNGGYNFNSVITGMPLFSGSCSVAPDGSSIAFYGDGQPHIWLATDYNFTDFKNVSVPYSPYFIRFSGDGKCVLGGTGSSDSFMFLSKSYGANGTFSSVGLAQSWYDASISDDCSSVMAVSITNPYDGKLIRSDNITAYNSTASWVTKCGLSGSYVGLGCDAINRNCIISPGSGPLLLTTDGGETCTSTLGDGGYSWTNAGARMTSDGNYMCAAKINGNIYCSVNEKNSFVNGINAPSFNASGRVTSNGLTVSSGTVVLPAGSVANAALANSAITVSTTNPVRGGAAVSLGGTVTLSLNTTANYTMNSANITTTSYIAGSQICTAANGACPTGSGSTIVLYNSTGGSQNTTAFNFTGTAVTSSYVDANNVTQIVLTAGAGSGGGFNATGSPELYNDSDTLYFNQSYNNATVLSVCSIYNNTLAINSVNTTLNIMSLGFTNSTQLIINLSQRLLATDQRYNETSMISSVNTTSNIMSLGFTNSTQLITNLSQRVLPGTCAAGTVVQNTTTTGVQCVTVSSSGGDGTGGWTNTSTVTSTALNVNITGTLIVNTINSSTKPFFNYNGTHNLIYHTDGTLAFIIN